MLLSGIPDYPSSLIYEDGSELRLCPLVKTRGKPLYCSADARFFSYTLRKNKTTKRFERVLRQVKPWKTTHAPSRKSGGWQNYLKVGAGGYYCHILMAWAWLKHPLSNSDSGLTAKRSNRRSRANNAVVYQVHHLNGVTTDNRPDNLIWLSVSRHHHYDRRLKALKTLITNVSIFSRRDFIRFARMSEVSFTAMLAKYYRDPSFDQMEYEMTHHMEI